ncbi:MAG: hypothetical protein ABJA81_08980, partial [Nocardioidaceae bacterium]
MTNHTQPVSSEVEDLAQGIADQTETFLLALSEISRAGDRGTAVPLLLLEVSQLLLAGARLGVQIDFVPSEQFEPDAGPDPDLDGIRMDNVIEAAARALAAGDPLAALN